MKNKIVMITGATSGIGLVSAETIAKMGATLVLVARNETKAAQVVENLKSSTGNPNIEYIIGDFSLMGEVKKVAEEFKRRQFYRLDVLMNNVGILCGERKLTAEGHEKTMATNQYSWLLLTQLLMTQLKSSPAARIVNVASEAHKMGKVSFDNIDQEKKFSVYGSYAASKIAMIASSYELTRQLEKTNITVNSLHPGVVKTNFGNGVKKPLLFKIVGFFMRRITPEEGAKTQIYLATSPEVEGVTGKYWNERSQQIPSNSQTMDEVFQKKIFDLSMEKIGMGILAK